MIETRCMIGGDYLERLERRLANGQTQKCASFLEEEESALLLGEWRLFTLGGERITNM